MNQRTLSNPCSFEGKGLHSGRLSHMRVCPADAGTGIRFVRTDMPGSEAVEAVYSNVSSTSRSTTISRGKASVSTVEHLLSALTGLGIDNALIEIDGPEVPILDGSAAPFAEAFLKAGTVEQDAERKWLELKDEVIFRNEKTGSYVKVSPCDDLSYECTIDFNSKVLGVQTASWDLSKDYATEVAPCRTFCFLHEIQLLATLGLVKGGDVGNAIIVVEKKVSDRTLARLARVFGQPKLDVTPQGYLSNLQLRFPDECGRHKLLDLIGDLRLCGGFLKARIEAYKPGHSVNTQAAGVIVGKLK